MIKKFSLPDYYGKYRYILKILEYKETHPNLFYLDREIDNCYGAHPDILWTGGRNVEHDQNISMSDILDGYNKYPKVELRHVCTNLFITPEIANDYKTNFFMSKFLRSNDKLIVANPLLIDYIKEKYPNTKLVYSTTMNITDIDEINKITKDNIYVMNYNYNNNDKYLAQLKHPENIEVLCGEPCIPNCSTRMNHYECISKIILGQAKIDDFECPNGSESRSIRDIMQLPTAITSKRIDELANMGIQYFKISGRNLQVPKWLALIVYYLVLPSQRDNVYVELLDSWW